jgi:hypothetical protein
MSKSVFKMGFMLSILRGRPLMIWGGRWVKSEKKRIIKQLWPEFCYFKAAEPGFFLYPAAGSGKFCYQAAGSGKKYYQAAGSGK